jgi:hypothetical protein
MGRDQRSRRCHRLACAGDLEVALTVLTVGAADFAMVKCECRDCNGR